MEPVEISELDQRRREITAWVGSQVLPHEADVRRWLRHRMDSQTDVDDVVQEAFCRLADLSSVAHIGSGRAYFFSTVRNILADQLRRSRIVRIDSVAEMESLNLLDEEPSPEDVIGARRELERVRQLIQGLPEKCRRVFILRRIEGVPQREIARKLGISEHTVEAQAVRGLKLILQALAEGEGAEGSRTRRSADGRRRTQSR